MTNNLETDVNAVFTDAWNQYNSAMERLSAGEILDACEKAWDATREATRAAALAHGEDLQNANHISIWIRRMARRKSEFEAMPLMFGARAHFLQKQACFDGYINEPDIPDLICDTADYIRQAQQLALQ